MKNHYRYLRNLLSVTFAVSLLLSVAPAAVSADTHDRGGNSSAHSSTGGHGSAGPSRGGPSGQPGNGRSVTRDYQGPSSNTYRGSTYRGSSNTYPGPVYRGPAQPINVRPITRRTNTQPSGSTNSTYRGTSNRGNSSGYGTYNGSNRYTGRGNVNPTYARYPEAYHGSWVNQGRQRWYNGYWHNYWGSASWLWWGGNYGFWFPYNGITVFVYEESPDVCQYWDGYEWVPYYDPQTGYYCPY